MNNIEKKGLIDIIIIGGGIAGLWTYNRLKSLGFNAILIEKQALGCGQTLKAQGIIHGGIKYALTGKLTKEAKAISAMPKVWQQCLEGMGPIDLTKVKVLSPYHYLWTNNELRAKVTQFLASQALASHSQAISKSEYPSLFQHKEFNGRVYRVSENVLDVPSLLTELQQPYRDGILQVDNLQLHYNEDNGLDSVTLMSKQHDAIHLKAQCYIFTAGEGNEKLNEHMKDAPLMQCRPLHMVLAKLPYSYPVYAHCIGVDGQPRITITTHQTKKGTCIWYLGGKIAEDGVKRSYEQQANVARAEINALFPWLDVTGVTFKSFFVNRAEVKQPHQKKPDYSFMKKVGNTITAWPTKLAFAPQLSDNILHYLQEIKIEPEHPPLTFLTDWPKATVADSVWDELFKGE